MSLSHDALVYTFLFINNTIAVEAIKFGNMGIKQSLDFSGNVLPQLTQL
jgi:hypothetical protein